jgi:hypothetical protein
MERKRDKMKERNEGKIRRNKDFFFERIQRRSKRETERVTKKQREVPSFEFGITDITMSSDIIVKD